MPPRAKAAVVAKDVCDTAEAAAYLGVCVAYLETLRIKGGGPRFARLSPRIIRYRREALDAWCASREVGSTSEPTKP
jgi:hypothetical protein